MNTEAEAIAALASAANIPQILKSDDGRLFLLHPEGTEMQEVSDPHGLKLNRPRYVSQAVTLQTRDSLASYVNRFKSDATVLFADMERSTIVAVIDYHEADGKADQTAHRASMVLPFSEEWRLWTGISGKLMGQLEFARFIEENAADVSAPPAADLLETIRDLQAHRKVNFTKAVRTSSDNENFEFTVETEAMSRNGGVEIPTRFELALPVYFGEPNTPLYAFLRWKLDEGSLQLGIQLHRAEHVRQASFRMIATDIAERTQTPVVYGRI